MLRSDEWDCGVCLNPGLCPIQTKKARASCGLRVGLRSKREETWDGVRVRDNFLRDGFFLQPGRDKMRKRREERSRGSDSWGWGTTEAIDEVGLRRDVRNRGIDEVGLSEGTYLLLISRVERMRGRRSLTHPPTPDS